MAFTENDLIVLEKAIKSGQRRVTYGDRTVEYQSMKDMLAARREIRSEIDAAAGVPRRRRTWRVYQSGSGL